MEFTPEMNLVSPSGYCMPFDRPGYVIDISRPYGSEDQSVTSDDGTTVIESSDFHHGIDFNTRDYVLNAIADGVVCGITVDRKEHGPQVVIKYDKYEVTYAGLKELNVQFGQAVHPLDIVGKSGETLHIGVKYDGEEMDPNMFLSMLDQNTSIWPANKNVKPSMPQTMEVQTAYDDRMDEIGGLMIKYLPNYFNDLASGKYQVPESTETSLRNLINVGMQQNYFYETIPSNGNLLGMTENALPLIIKAQNLLIEDFLNYMTVIQKVLFGGDPKKKVMMTN